MTDESSTSRASGAGCVLIPPEGDHLKYALILTFPATNNEAEYEALITGLMIARGAGARNLHVKCDSQLVVRQVLGKCEAREDRIVKYAERANSLIAKFSTVKVEQVPHEENTSLSLSAE